MDKPMEHLKVLYNRYSGILTPNEVAIYIHLFMLANQRYWPEWIEIADWQLASSANISVRSIPTVINSLVQKELLTAERGKGKKQSRYHVIPLAKDNIPSPNYTKNDIITRRKVVDNSEITRRKVVDNSEITRRYEPETHCESKDVATLKTKTTQHKDKDNNISMRVPARKKFIPPTLDEVNAYILEKGLHVSAKSFLDYFEATGWVDAKGQPVRSWKGKLLTWEKFQPPNQKTRTEESMDAANRAIAFFEGEEALRDEQGSGDCEAAAAVPFGFSQRGDAG